MVPTQERCPMRVSLAISIKDVPKLTTMAIQWLISEKIDKPFQTSELKIHWLKNSNTILKCTKEPPKYKIKTNLFRFLSQKSIRWSKMKALYSAKKEIPNHFPNSCSPHSVRIIYQNIMFKDGRKEAQCRRDHIAS